MDLNINAPFIGGAITMVHGKTRRFRFQVQDRATFAGVDVTTWSSFRFLAKTNLTDADSAAVVIKSLGSGIIAVQAPSGLLEVLLQPNDTNSLADMPTHLFAEIQGVDGSGLPWSLWQGELDIQPTVIQAGN